MSHLEESTQSFFIVSKTNFTRLINGLNWSHFSENLVGFRKLNTTITVMAFMEITIYTSHNNA